MFEFSKVVREIILEYKETISFPLFYSFLKSSCESSSYFLGELLAQSFLNNKFYIVHDYHHTSDENHFGIGIDNNVIDTAAEQFVYISSPIYGAEKNPLAGKFKTEFKIDAFHGIRKFDLIEL